MAAVFLAVALTLKAFSPLVQPMTTSSWNPSWIPLTGWEHFRFWLF